MMRVPVDTAERKHRSAFRSPKALWLRGLLLVAGLVALGVMPCVAEVPAAADGGRHDVVGESGTELPQWEDVGLEDLLVVTSQPTVPTSRPARQFSALGEAVAQRALPHGPKAVEQTSLLAEERTAPGCYIYFLLSLRL